MLAFPTACPVDKGVCRGPTRDAQLEQPFYDANRMARFRWLAAGAIAWAGIVLGHLVSYWLAYPHPEIRADHLAATGHQALPIALVSAAAVVPAILVLLAVRTLRGPPLPPMRRFAGGLAAIQVPGFLLMELVERGMALERLGQEPALLLGILVQVLVAVAVALLCRAFMGVVAALASHARRHRRIHVRVRWPEPRHDLSNRLVFLIHTRRRAPPASLCA
jgi:hypothetical protein